MFRFTIRELLVLTVTVGLAVGWWMEHRSLATANDSLARSATLWRWRAEHLVWFFGDKGYTVKWDAIEMKVFNPDGNFAFGSVVPNYEVGVPVEQQVLQIGIKDGKWER